MLLLAAMAGIRVLRFFPMRRPARRRAAGRRLRPLFRRLIRKREDAYVKRAPAAAPSARRAARVGAHVAEKSRCSSAPRRLPAPRSDAMSPSNASPSSASTRFSSEPRAPAKPPESRAAPPAILPCHASTSSPPSQPPPCRTRSPPARPPWARSSSRSSSTACRSRRRTSSTWRSRASTTGSTSTA